MVADIENAMQANSVHTGRQALGGRVHDVFLEVPRHEFLKPELAHAAYENPPFQSRAGSDCHRHLSSP